MKISSLLWKIDNEIHYEVFYHGVEGVIRRQSSSSYLNFRCVRKKFLEAFMLRTCDKDGVVL